MWTLEHTRWHTHAPLKTSTFSFLHDAFFEWYLMVAWVTVELHCRMAEQTHTQCVEDGMSVKVKCHRESAVQKKKEEDRRRNTWSERERERKGRKILNMSGKVCGNNKEMWWTSKKETQRHKGGNTPTTREKAHKKIKTEQGRKENKRHTVMVNSSTFLFCHRIQFSDRLHVQGVRFTALTRVHLTRVSNDSVCRHCKRVMG